MTQHPTNKNFPSIACAKKGEVYSLSVESLMMFGAYKNDLKTRHFFEKHIGPFFHFTAFGVDWFEEQWRNKNPLTYQEFIDFWKAEYKKRLHQKASPKEEWAYINFTQDYLSQFPKSTSKAMRQAWRKVRQEKKDFIEEIFQKIEAYF